MIERGLGMARIKAEGAPAHPDDVYFDGMSDEDYLRLLYAYEEATGDPTARACLIRDYLVRKL